MEYLIVNAKERTRQMVDTQTINDAYKIAGLKAGELDHGNIAYDQHGNSLNLFVYQYGFYEPVDQAYFFSIHRRLFVGNAVLYAADQQGETIPVLTAPEIMFYKSYHEVEEAIARDEIDRPYNAVNGVVTWQWPQSQGDE